VGLPAPNGSRNFDGLTSDSRPVDFRFSGGWLTVERRPANAPPNSADMEEVLSVCISPFGVMDIYPEQICDILGLTVNGRKIDSTGIAAAARGFNWSGRTTYWHSTHLMQPREDARIFIQQLIDTFPGSILVQPVWGSHARLRCRRIRFLMATDDVVTLGIRYDKVRLEKLLDAEESSWDEFENVFSYSIEFSRRDSDGDDVTGERYIRSRGSAPPGLDYHTIPHRQYRIRTEYLTDDVEAQSLTGKLLSIMDSYFGRGLRTVNLQTGAVLAENMEDEEDEKSYSKALRDECLERPKQYLFVGVTTGESPAFYGARPANSR
jgi:hypothetical protein